MSFLIRKLKQLYLDYQIKKQSKFKIIQKDDIADLYFFQFKKQTCEFFFRKLGKAEVLIGETPHFQLAKAWSCGDLGKIEQGVKCYSEYITESWGGVSSQLIEKRVRAFNNQYNYAIKNSLNSLPPPVITTIPGSGKQYVVDGNHRVSIALAMSEDLKVCHIPFHLAFSRYTTISGYYGINSKNLPYQSIYNKKSIVAFGRRRDLVDRLNLIPDYALKGKSLLDVASNIGMSSIVSSEFGVVKSLGLEKSKEMVDVSNRFSMLAGLYPHTSFIEFDIDFDLLPSDLIFDTAFIFSIYSHLKTPSKLLDIARNNVKQYVIFEGHPGHSYENYVTFFESGLFSKVEKLGTLDTSFFDKTKSRDLWICFK